MVGDSELARSSRWNHEFLSRHKVQNMNLQSVTCDVRYLVPLLKLVMKAAMLGLEAMDSQLLNCSCRVPKAKLKMLERYNGMVQSLRLRLGLEAPVMTLYGLLLFSSTTVPTGQ